MENILISFYIGMVILLCIMTVYMASCMIWDSIDGWKDILKWMFGVPAFIFVSYWLGHFVIKFFELM